MRAKRRNLAPQFLHFAFRTRSPRAVYGDGQRDTLFKQFDLTIAPLQPSG